MKSHIVAAAVCGLLLSNAVQSAELKVLSSGAVKETVIELLPQFEKSSGHKVAVTWAGTVDVKKRIAAGETYDLVVVAGPEIDAFVKQGKIASGSRIDLMKSGVGVAVKAGAPKPDIGSSEALKKALLAAKSVAYSTGPSGVYIEGLLKRLGIADQIKPKTQTTKPGERVAALVASGQAEIGFQQVSELIHEPGIAYLGPLSSDIQKVTVFSSGVHSGAKEPQAAKALQDFLTSPAAAPAIKRHGMEPG